MRLEGAMRNPKVPQTPPAPPGLGYRRGKKKGHATVAA